MSPNVTVNGQQVNGIPTQEMKAKAGQLREALVIERSEKLQPKPALQGLQFGRVFSDHMLQIEWTKSNGWTNPIVKPLTNFQIHPCAQVFHYALECFEGMKAYKDAEGAVRLFRPMMNMNRLRNSALRMNFGTFNQEDVLECIKELLKVERDWIPSQEGFSLYLRPTVIATSAMLGVSAPTEALLYVVLCPVGPYYPSGMKPIKLFIDLQNARAWPGGVGDKKVGGNYAPTILPNLQAAKMGCSQVLYVLKNAEDDGLVGESGAMNVFFLLRSRKGVLELVTPPLDGTILPGVTRDSVLCLCRTWGEFSVSERQLQLRELMDASTEGRLIEIFGTGTACIVQPVEALRPASGPDLCTPFNAAAAAYWMSEKKGKAMEAPQEGEPFSLCGRLTRALLDIQHGRVEHDGWSIVID